MHFVLWAALLLVAFPPTGARGEDLPLEVYGTRSPSTEEVQARLGKDVKEFIRFRRLALQARGKRVSEFDIRARSLKQSIESDARSMGRFALVRLDIYEKIGAPDDAFFTLEFVEDKDKDTRLPFRKAPTGSIRDSGLIQAWTRYADAGRVLVRKGDISTDRASCPAFFCTVGAPTPALKELQDRFVEEVPAYKGLLVQVLREDRDPARRANALYLLTYLKDASEVIDHARYGLLDPEERVREAALEIFIDMVLHHPGLPVPVEAVVPGLDYPSADDRRRALAFMLSLANKPDYRPFLIKQALPDILKLLRLRHPAVHEMAYVVLGLLSGETINARDYEAWEQWAHRARGALEVAERDARAAGAEGKAQ